MPNCEAIPAKAVAECHWLRVSSYPGKFEERRKYTFLHLPLLPPLKQKGPKIDAQTSASINGQKCRVGNELLHRGVDYRRLSFRMVVEGGLCPVHRDVRGSNPCKFCSWSRIV